MGRNGLHPWCRSCVAVKSKAKRLANPEKEAQRLRDWRKKNPEKVKAQSKKGYESRKELQISYAIEYQAKHPEKKKEWDAKYRDKHKHKLSSWRVSNRGLIRQYAKIREAIIKAMTPPWLSASQISIMQQIKIAAQRISKCTGIPHHVDHIFPFQSPVASGLNVPSNLQIITAKQNLRKKNSLPKTNP